MVIYRLPVMSVPTISKKERTIGNHKCFPVAALPKQVPSQIPIVTLPVGSLKVPHSYVVPRNYSLHRRLTGPCECVFFRGDF